MKRSIALTMSMASALVIGVSMSGPAQAAADTCSPGTHYTGHSLGSLSNGMLYGGWCSTNGTDRDIVRANVGYKKTSGSGVSVALGWERTNRNATVNGGSWWSATYNVAPGQTKEVAFYPGHVAITSTYPCIRAKMKDQISGQLFFGKLLCLA